MVKPALLTFDALVSTFFVAFLAGPFFTAFFVSGFTVADAGFFFTADLGPTPFPVRFFTGPFNRTSNALCR